MMKTDWATMVSTTAIRAISQATRWPATSICHREKTSVTGHSTAHIHTGSLYQNNRSSGVFSGSMFRQSSPSLASNRLATQ